MPAADLLPTDADLPGAGWLAIDEGFGGGAGEGPGALLDCVGPEFPDDDVVASAASPHFVRPPGTLVHGLAVEFASASGAAVAEDVLASTGFAECLGRSVAADLEAGATDAELLGVEVSTTGHGHRVRFTGGDARGVRPVNLDVVCVRRAEVVGVLWCGDTPAPFPTADLDHLVGRLRAR